MVFVLIVCLLILYSLWDVNYFLRCIFTLGYGTFFQAKAKIMDPTCIYGEFLLPILELTSTNDPSSHFQGSAPPTTWTFSSGT